MNNAIKNLGLTVNDFDMMVEGLEELPNKGATGDLLVDLFSSSMMEDGPEKDKFKKDREEEKAKKSREAELMKENIRILQGKLISMKRLLIENNLMDEAKESLSH